MSDQQAIYAYDDTTVVGKLDVQAYSYKDVKVHLVRVNNTKTLDLGKIEKEVNDIWQQAVVKYTFDELEPITIDYANKEHFVHGGKGTFQNYNEDQKTAIKALPEGVDDNDYYLFFVDCYDRLDTAGMKSNEPVSGYMPVGRHYGFIYNEFNNTRTISHELGHGVNVLHHTFSDDSESFHTTAKTDNLMDYNGGIALNHKQWQWSHEKHRNVLGFLDGEEESEFREKCNIKWIGDWLEGYASDDLEKMVEDKLPLFNDIAKNYDSYYGKSASDNVDVQGWSVRTSSHKMSIGKSLFEKISKQEAPQFSLHDKGIYFENYRLEDIDYRLAVYSYSSSVQLNVEDVKIRSYSDLADNKNIKAGFTKREGGYGLIVFYQNSAPIMVLQIIDKTPEKAVDKWLNYLSLVLPSDEQKRKDGENASGFEIHPIEKLIEIWESWFDSQIQEIDLSNDVIFYSQFDDIFNCETCWPHLKTDSVSYTSNQCCNKACLKILESVGQSTNRSNQVVAVNYSDINNIIPNENAEDVIKLINTSLFEHKLPIMVGVHHPQSKNDRGIVLETLSTNTPSITNHYVVIVGKLYDISQKQYYYKFFEVGTRQGQGVSTRNRLYLFENKLIKGYTSYKDEDWYYYILTEVRKNINKIY